jgi:hypothetical protein
MLRNGRGTGYGCKEGVAGRFWDMLLRILMTKITIWTRI